MSFLLLANINILVHTIVCHHHYDDISVIYSTHCEHDCGSHNNHQHDDNSPSDHCKDPYCHGSINDCLLTNFCVKFGNDKSTFQLVYFNFNFLPFISSLFSDYSLQPIYNNTCLPFRQKPYLPSYYTDYVSQSFGLRAPPF